MTALANKRVAENKPAVLKERPSAVEAAAAQTDPAERKQRDFPANQQRKRRSAIPTKRKSLKEVSCPVHFFLEMNWTHPENGAIV